MGRLVPVRRALVSVHDKRGLVEFARALAERGVSLLSTGGSARRLREAGLTVRDVAEETGFPEMLDGRVKTLHPRVHGALLARREDPDHLRALEAHAIRPIDLVVVNLYPFEVTVARPLVRDLEAVEQIDIGGPSMIRSAAKNHAWVGAVTDPSQYAEVLADLAAHDGALSEALRHRLARAAFARTAAYDAAIHGWLAGREGDPLPDVLGSARRAATLRYGENPHQRAALYAMPAAPDGALAGARLLQGKEPSFNNYGDADAAWALVRELAEPACVVVKHANPCGAALASDPVQAWEAAVACDPRSAFGGIVALNRPLTAEVARAMAVPERFLEVLVVPQVAAGALAPFTVPGAPRWGASLRVLEAGSAAGRPEGLGTPHGLDVRSIDGGYLVQERDQELVDPTGPQVATRRAPTEAEARDLAFAWTVCRHVRSNAIVLALGGRAIGVGAGQMSRVEATELAVARARRWAAEQGEDLHGMVVASDAFYPFNDAIELALDAGARAFAQPGGSRNDAQAVALLDRQGAAMWMTGRRHFRH